MKLSFISNRKPSMKHSRMSWSGVVILHGYPMLLQVSFFFSIFQPLISSGTKEITILFDQIFMRTCLFQGMVNYIFLLCLPTTPELTDALLSCHLITGRLLEQISLQAE